MSASVLRLLPSAGWHDRVDKAPRPGIHMFILLDIDLNAMVYENCVHIQSMLCIVRYP